MKFDCYNYTKQEGFEATFPMTEDEIAKLNSTGEVMVEIPGYEVGVNLTTMNEFVKMLEENGVDEKSYNILSKAYLFNEIKERLEKGESFSIIDFGAETSNWMSASFYDESDKGRLLYELELAKFPVEVPEELVEYMDYAMLWRNESINQGIREVDGNYLVA